jgi:hypothetical protein
LGSTDPIEAKFFWSGPHRPHSLSSG